MRMRALETIQKERMIMAVKSDKELDIALRSKPTIIFLLYGDIMTLPQVVQRIQGRRKMAIVHLDLIMGLSSHEMTVDYLQRVIQADGIITTHPNLAAKAHENHFFSILRYFLLDSLSLRNLQSQVDKHRPTVLEVLPGIIPTVIPEIQEKVDIPIIAGGFIRTQEQGLAVLEHGGLALSSSSADLWAQADRFVLPHDPASK